MNIAIVGCGDVGTRCARMLLDAGHQVVGVRRNAAVLPDWLPSLCADVTEIASLEFLFGENQSDFDAVIYALAAADFTEQAYRCAYVDGVRNTLKALASRPPKRFFFVSSTGVYHQNDGSVVNEDSPVEPTRFNGQLVLQGEHLVRSHEFGSCVRFSGIYGPGRHRLINRVASGQATLDKSPAFTNRIHIEDCAAVLAHLVNLVENGAELDPIYLASDCLPAPGADVESFIADALGLSLQQAESVAPARRIAGSKRCDNQRLLNSGYVFKYPDYKAGYRQVIDAMKSNASGSDVQ